MICFTQQHHPNFWMKMKNKFFYTNKNMVFLVVWSLDSQDWDWGGHFNACDTYISRHESDIPKESILFATSTYEEAEKIAKDRAEEYDWPSQVVEVEEPKRAGKCTMNWFGICYPSRFLDMDNGTSDEESSDGETSDGETSDGETSDGETSDEE